MDTRSFLPAALAALVLLPSLSLADNEIGYVEKFALAPDREKVLRELVPGSEDYYFFHALHYQNTRNEAKLAEILKLWEERYPNENPRRRIILNREALLAYDTTPQQTLAYLRERLGIHLNHQQEARDAKPNLPTKLDPARISREVFEKDAIQWDAGLQTLSQDALESLVARQVKLTAQQRRSLLGKLTRPDVKSLVELIVTELNSENTSGFGAYPIHRALLPGQLDALVKAVPALATNSAYVYTRLRKLAPSADVDIEFNDAEREAWLERLWVYAKTLPPAFNTIKAHILYQRLDLDRKKGIYSHDLFLEYLKLPRQLGYVNPLWIRQRMEHNENPVDLNANLSEALLQARPINDDEPLVREYFLQIFASKAAPGAITYDDPQNLAPWTNYVRDTWLKPIFAEAKIVNNIGSMERWASLLTPQAYQALKERVDIEFPKTNAQFFQPGDDIKVDVIAKNTPTLLVKIYEVNTLNFFLGQARQLNTDLNLDGLVANSERTVTYDGGPFIRKRQTFDFPELKNKRGAWVIEFIGGGRSSRALVRTGQWQVLQQTGPAGDLLTVIDEKAQPVKDAVAWLDGRKLKTDEKLGRISVPFTNKPGRRNIVLADAAGTFATLTQFDHHAENYALDTQFYVEREQLLARREATVVVRPALILGDTRLDPAMLAEPKLTITSTTIDGISTTRDVKDLKLTAANVLTHRFTVPERLAKLDVTLSGQIDVLSAGGEKRTLSSSHSWPINGIDKTEKTFTGYLSKFANEYSYELLGKNGEPIPDRQVVFHFYRRDFTREQNVALQSDEKGRITLGNLAGIALLVADLPNDTQDSHSLDTFGRTWSTVIHAKAGDTLRVPFPETWEAGSSDNDLSDISLLQINADTFTADHSAKVKTQDQFLVLEGLAPGDYSLHFRNSSPDISIKITDGKLVSGWLIGTARNLEAKSTNVLQVTDVKEDNGVISVKLANVTPFTRVHIAATRFEPADGIFGGLAGFQRFGLSTGIPARLPNLYATGRDVGDEYRYILERRSSKLFPGNMLTRPGLLLNPWAVNDTDLNAISQASAEALKSTMAGRSGGTARSRETHAMGTLPSKMEFPNLDFLTNTAPSIYNLVPDKDGVVKLERKALGDRQHLQIYAEDLNDAVWKSFALPDSGTKFADLRLAQAFDPAKPFAQRKETTVLATGQSLSLADILTSELETYDTLSGVYSLYTTLSHDSELAKFAWVLQWPTLKDQEKRAKYSEFACHELNLFLWRKDNAFFEAVVKPYLANKKDKTFMDDFLLGNELRPYLAPWAYERLNVVERALLAHRLQTEAANTARNLRELWELLPPDPERSDFLFETGLRGRAMENAEEEKASGRLKSALRDGKDEAAKAITTDSRMEPIPGLPAAAPAPMSMMPKAAATPANRFAAKKADAPADQLAAQEQTSGDVDRDGFDPGYFDKNTARDARANTRPYYRAVGPTKEWAENNYWHLRIAKQDGTLIPISAFWRDYAAHLAEGKKTGFVSPHFAEASHNFAEMMLALAVLDLPFEAQKHSSKADGGKFTLTAASPLVVFHKEVKPADPATPDTNQLLVSQSFYRHGDRYRKVGNEQFEKNVTEEFLTGTVYAANVVVTNPTSVPVKAEVLMQIPQGSLPVLGSKATNSRFVRLEPYTTTRFEYAFYFPAIPAKAGTKFDHFPVNVSVANVAAAAAKPFAFNVVAKLTQFDKASWDYISQYGSETDVFTFLEQNNLASIQMARIAWRCKDPAFFRKLTAFLAAHHLWDNTIYSYALMHNDTGALCEWLKHQDTFVSQCGPFLASKLVVLDPIERHSFEHLEYSPLVNQRAHRLGTENRIANPALLAEYRSLLDILAHKPALDTGDSMSVTYFLFLQDRVDEALTRFHAIDAKEFPTKIQHDYLRCYADFYEGNTADARTVASKYAGYPVVRWQKLFADVTSQLDEIDGKTIAKNSPDKSQQGTDSPDSRENHQTELAASEPSLDFNVENKTIALSWKNLTGVTINYYLMDAEFSFSSNPFVGEDANRLSIVKPSKSVALQLPKDKDSLDLPLPAEFAKANVLVEVLAAGQRKTQAYHANTLKLTLVENYGRLEVRDSGTDKALSKAYVKVYARLKNGTVRFYKDGYTDLRGRFDYASLNEAQAAPVPIPLTAQSNESKSALDHQMLRPGELDQVDKLAILVLSEANGAATRELNPPRQ